MTPAKRLMIEHLRGLAEQGKTLAEAAAISGLAYNTISHLSRPNGIRFKRQFMSERPGVRERANEMRRLYEDGRTLEQIGQKFGVSRERVRQIMTRRFGLTAQGGGKSELARRRRRDLHNGRDAKSQKAWGCSYAQYRWLLKQPGKPHYAFRGQRNNAHFRGIAWEITFWQWWQTWQKSGHWPERGRGHGYCMCRLNDTGPYAVDNVYIATGVENMQDYWANKRASELRSAA